MKTAPLFVVLSWITMLGTLNLYGQTPGYTISGPTSNLCPEVLYKYTAPATSGNIDCNLTQAWLCKGCFNTDKQVIDVIDKGVDSNGNMWATVKWANVATGQISNACGTLSVSIASVAQPTITPSTITLCGNGNIDLAANVASTDNIVGYSWFIKGTGVSPTSTVTTSTPNLKLTYSNWTVSNVNSATVSVGAKHSCGFITHLTPLQNETILGITFPAIPRSAWVQLSTGNIDNLKVPYNFTTPTICTSGNLGISNQPTGTNVNWVSANPSALQVNDASTGAVTRLNNYTGYVNMAVTVSNSCGSNTQNYNVYLGLPAANINTLIYASGSRGLNPVSLNPASTYSFSSDQVPGATSYNWYLPSGFSFMGANGSSSVFINTPSNASGSYSLSCAATNACGYNFTNNLIMQFGSTGGGGTGSGGGRKPPIAVMAAPPFKFNMYPNPSIHSFIVNVMDTTVNENPITDYEVRLFDQTSKEVFYIRANSAETHIPADHLPPNIYYLVIQSKEGILKEELLINH
jgi:hypothetical protein